MEFELYQLQLPEGMVLPVWHGAGTREWLWNGESRGQQLHHTSC